MPTVTKKLDAGDYQLKDQVVAINRVTKVVKGGKNLSFAALVVVGDPSAAVVGYGSGKAKEVPQAIRKGIESAKKNLLKVNLTQNSIPHLVLGRFGSGHVLLKPAPEGTGVIAGGAVRAVMTSVGIQNVLTKSIGTTNPHNVIKATFDALKKLRTRKRSRRCAARTRKSCRSAFSPQRSARTPVSRGGRPGSLGAESGSLIEDWDGCQNNIEVGFGDAAHQVGALGNLRPGEAQAGGQGPWFHPAEPGDRAARHARHPRDGEKGAPPGGDRGRVKFPGFKVFPMDREAGSAAVGTCKARHFGTWAGQRAEHEFIQRSSTEEIVGKPQARRPRHGFGHGQDLDPRAQGPAVAQRLAHDARL